MKSKDQLLLEEAYKQVTENIFSKLNPFKKKETPAERSKQQQLEASEQEKTKFAQQWKNEPRLKAPYENYSIHYWRGVFPTAGEPETDHFLVLDHENSLRYPTNKGDTYSSREQAMEIIKAIENKKKEQL
jgi:hypothetical protein